MKNSIVYGGRSLDEFGLSLIDGSTSFVSPEKEYELISIPGRNGDLTIFNKFSDVDVSIPMYIHRNFVENYRNLLQFLNGSNGYQRFEISNDPDHFRKALFLGAVVPKTGPFNFNGRFSLRFRMNPQRWLKQGENWSEFDDTATQQSPAAIFNPTLQTAKPIIKVYGSGVVAINGYAFTIDSNTYEYVEVDCENSDVYYKGTSVVNLNSLFSGYFPTLKLGENEIFLIGPTKIEIQPRWFEI